MGHLYRSRPQKLSKNQCVIQNTHFFYAAGHHKKHPNIVSNYMHKKTANCKLGKNTAQNVRSHLDDSALLSDLRFAANLDYLCASRTA